MQILQDELEQIKELKHKFSKFSSQEHLMPEFLAISTSLNQNIERILSKPLPPANNIDPWELPHELKDIREALD